MENKERSVEEQIKDIDDLVLEKATSGENKAMMRGLVKRTRTQERQKRKEVRQETMRKVISKLRRQFNSEDDELSLEEIEVALYELDEEALTQPNNSK